MSKQLSRCKEAERSIIKKFRKQIWTKFTSAVNEFELIEKDDKIAVCISGGKDSMIMAKCMQELMRHGHTPFSLEFIVMNPGYNKENYDKICENAKILEIPVHFFDTPIFDIVDTVADSPCYLCARMRRGYLYSKAKELGCNKIALGHHFDDVVETVILSMFYGSEFKTMLPKLKSTNFEGMQLIRPMYFVREEDIILWAKYNNLEFIRCACRFTAESQYNEEKSKRKEIKEFLRKVREKNANVDYNIYKSTCGVNLKTVLGYKNEGEKHFFLDEFKKSYKFKEVKIMALKKINDLGEITISEKAIEEVAGFAATHCYGVVGMSEKNSAEVIKKFFKAPGGLRHGIKATLKDNEISVDIHIKVSYGVNIKILAENVKQDIAYAISNMTNDKIKEINVYIDDIVVNK